MQTQESDPRRKAVRLEYLTIAWMLVEASVALASGIAAGSIALIGFGLDSVIELFAAFVVLWQLRGHSQDQERKERAALKMIGGSFFILALYVSVQSIYDLVGGAKPEHAPVGIAVTVAALIVMPLLGRAKAKTARQLGNEVLLADSKETLFCALLSAVALGGLMFNATLSWWWADPIAALGVAYLAVREGREAWRGDRCC